MSKRNSSKKSSFVQKAFYPGGKDALKVFISANLKYPEEAIKHQAEGTVHAEYTVNHRGKVTKVKALTKIGHGLEEEAIRLTKLLKFAVPQKVRNIRVTFNKTIWINFKLPKTPPVQEQAATKEDEKVPTIDNKEIKQEVQYTIVPTPEPKEVKEEDKPKKDENTNTITYTIKYNN